MPGDTFDTGCVAVLVSLSVESRAHCKASGAKCGVWALAGGAAAEVAASPAGFSMPPPPVAITRRNSSSGSQLGAHLRLALCSCMLLWAGCWSRTLWRKLGPFYSASGTRAILPAHATASLVLLLLSAAALLLQGYGLASEGCTNVAFLWDAG